MYNYGNCLGQSSYCKCLKTSDMQGTSHGMIRYTQMMNTPMEDEMIITKSVHIRGRRGVEEVVKPAFTARRDGGGHCVLTWVAELGEAAEEVDGDVLGMDDGESEVVNVRMTELWDDVEGDMDGGAVDDAGDAGDVGGEEYNEG